MSVGTMGARPVPKPSSQVVSEALSLLTAFGGGDKDIRKALVEMKDVQIANEALVEQAKTIIAEANIRANAVAAAEVALAKRQAEFEQTLRQSETRIARLNGEIDTRAEKAKAEQDAAAAELEAREKRVVAGEAYLAARIIDVQGKESAVAGQQGSLTAKAIELGHREAELNAAYERLRAAMPGA